MARSSHLRRSGVVAAATLLLCAVAAAGCGAEERAARSAPTTPEPARVPDTARVACDGDSTDVLTRRVRPQPDGIHVRFDNRAGAPLAYAVGSTRGGGLGGELPEGGAQIVVSMPPGRLALVCFDPSSGQDPGEKERAGLEVVDAEGLWTPSVPSASCDDRVATALDYAYGAEGERAAPVEVARRLLESRGVLEAGDVVERAGYPEGQPVSVRLARDGETLAVVDLVSDGKGGWLASTIDACAGIGLG